MDELLEEVWLCREDEDTVLRKRPLTVVLPLLRKHITMSGRQQYYVVPAQARGKQDSGCLPLARACTMLGPLPS